MTHKFKIDKSYITFNGSLVRCIDFGYRAVRFVVLFGGRSLGGFPCDDQFWNGQSVGDEYTALIPNGTYEGDIRAMDIFKSAYEDDFLLNSRYTTINNSIVKYIGNNYFEMIKNGNVSKKFPWNIIPEGTAYLVNIAGEHIGGFHQLSIREPLLEEKEQP